MSTCHTGRLQVIFTSPKLKSPAIGWRAGVNFHPCSTKRRERLTDTPVTPTSRVRYHAHDFSLVLNPLKPEFTIAIFIHYQPRIAAAILDS